MVSKCQKDRNFNVGSKCCYMLHYNHLVFVGVSVNSRPLFNLYHPHFLHLIRPLKFVEMYIAIAFLLSFNLCGANAHLL